MKKSVTIGRFTLLYLAIVITLMSAGIATTADAISLPSQSRNDLLHHQWC